jgi:hypothetical protein
MALMRRVRASGPVPYSGFILHSRLCAAVTAASALVHLGSVLENQHGLILNAVMVAMAAVCLPCAVHIWNRARPGTLQKIVASAIFMAVLHCFLLFAAAPSAHGHGGTAAVPGSGSPAAGASLGVIALELATGLLAAKLIARLRISQYSTRHSSR